MDFVGSFMILNDQMMAIGVIALAILKLEKQGITQLRKSKSVRPRSQRARF